MSHGRRLAVLGLSLLGTLFWALAIAGMTLLWVVGAAFWLLAESVAVDPPIVE